MQIEKEEKGGPPHTNKKAPLEIKQRILVWRSDFVRSWVSGSRKTSKHRTQANPARRFDFAARPLPENRSRTPGVCGVQGVEDFDCGGFRNW